MNFGRKLPAIPTWKLKHPREVLEAAAKDVATFNRGYRMMTVSPGELKFPSWEKCIQPGLSASELIARRLMIFTGVDLAGKRRPGNAIVTIGVDSAFRRCLLDVRFGKWKSPETARQLADVDQHLGPSVYEVENNGYQEALVDWIKESKFTFWPKVESFTTGSNKSDPDIGLPALEVEFFNSAWIIPGAEFQGHPPQCVCDWCRLHAEMKNYPRGASSDGVMALWFARSAASEWAPRMNMKPTPKSKFTRR